MVSLLYGVFLPISSYSITTVKSCLHYFSEEIDWRDCISLNKYGNAGKKMNYQNDDLRIKEINELLPPVALPGKFPATENAANTVAHARKAIHQILKGDDDRLLVVIGPCSIHDPAAAKEYAARLLTLREALKGELEIVMRVYFENRAPPSAGKGSSTIPIWITASASTTGCASRANCCWTLTTAACRRRGIPRYDHPAVCRRSDELGRHWRAYHRIPGAP